MEKNCINCCLQKGSWVLLLRHPLYSNSVVSEEMEVSSMCSACIVWLHRPYMYNITNDVHLIGCVVGHLSELQLYSHPLVWQTFIFSHS